MTIDLDAELKNVDRMLRDARGKVKTAKHDVRRLEGAREILAHLSQRADAEEGESLPALDSPVPVGAGANGAQHR